jgi:hypothetical protein
VNDGGANDAGDSSRGRTRASKSSTSRECIGASGSRPFRSAGAEGSSFSPREVVVAVRADSRVVVGVMNALAKLENRRVRDRRKPSRAASAGSSWCSTLLLFAALTFLRTSRICLPLSANKKMEIRMKHLVQILVGGSRLVADTTHQIGA